MVEIESRMSGNLLLDSRRWIEEHGDHLYRFALARVRNSDVAEDLVQETFLAALQGTCCDSGPTAEHKWMIGIIKHKIVDYFRTTAREPAHEFDQLDGRSADEDFLPDGHWPLLSRLCATGSPEPQIDDMEGAHPFSAEDMSSAPQLHRKTVPRRI